MTEVNHSLKERRLYSRIPVVSPVEVLGWIGGETANINEGGLCFSSRIQLPSTQTVSIRLDLPFSSPLESQVKIVWSHSFDRNSKFLYGVNFLNLNNEKTAILKESLSKCNFLNPDFIFLTGQLYSLLFDIKYKFEQFDIENESEKKQLEFIDKNKRQLYPVLSEHFKRIWQIIRNFNRSEYKLHQQYYRKILWHLLANATEINRTVCSKPLGYPGDYTIMNYFYNFHNRYLGNSSYEKFINYYSCNIPDALSVVKRKDFFRKKILKTLHTKNSARILSIGSGPGRELIELTQEGRVTKPLHFVCLDFEERALDYMRREIKKVDSKKRTHLNLKFINRNLLGLIKDKNIKSELGKYDLIYSSGLFDYLSDKVASKILETLCELLDKEATLIICNADEKNAKHRGYYEMLGDWQLNYRTQEGMLSWTKGIQSTQDIKFIRPDRKNLFLYLSLKRLSS